MKFCIGPPLATANDRKWAGVSGSPASSDAGSGFLLADYPAVLELDDAMTIHGVALGVRNLNDCRAGVVEALEELHDFIALRGVQVARRLVGEDKLGILDDRARDAHKLLLAAGKLVGEEIFFADDVEAVENVADQADAFLVRNVFVGERYFEVLEDREIVDQVVALKDEADIGFVQLVALFDVEFVDRLIKEIVFAAPRAVQHANDAEQRGFPRAGRAHEGYELTGLNIDTNTAQDEKLAAAGLEDLLEISHLNQRFHKLSLSCR